VLDSFFREELTPPLCWIFWSFLWLYKYCSAVCYCEIISVSNCNQLCQCSYHLRLFYTMQLIYRMMQQTSC